MNNVPYIKWLVSKDRPYAKDLPRDEFGRIKVDLAHPHILSDMSYFTQTRDYFKQHGEYTSLRVSPNPDSPFGKWIKQETRRSYEGMVNPDTGEWITGDMYFFLNYCPILLSKASSKNKKKLNRVKDFPDIWDGHYLKYHYINQARENGTHGAELSSRRKGKSYTAAEMLAKRFVVGESADVSKEVACLVTAYEQKYLTGANKVLDMFASYLDHLKDYTQWPSQTLINSLDSMKWTMGYLDLNTGARRGTLNTVTGISSKDNSGKLRGSGVVLALIEEFGTFRNLLNVYNVLRPSVEEGSGSYGFIYSYGTAGDTESDFRSAQEMMDNPAGYNMFPIKNVYDKINQGKNDFIYFFPGYIDRIGCIDENGNSDVTKALLQILLDREKVKNNSTDPNTISRRIAETPITPREVILKTSFSIFPITDLHERILQLDNNPNSYDDVWVGSLVNDSNGNIIFKADNSQQIMNFPLSNNKSEGAVCIYLMPQRDSSGNIPYNRYILSHDPVDDDDSNTLSLCSTFVLDTWTDSIAAECTGRIIGADNNYERVRKLCLFYNGTCLYEAHPYDQLVRLPDGTSKLWGDVNIGDTLFSPNGKTTKVVDIPVDGIDDIYKITLGDGRVVEASSNHKWVVNKSNKSNERIELSTIDMVNAGVVNKYNQHRFFIPESNAVEYKSQDVPIDAYTLGLLIAEGAFTKFKEYKTRMRNRKVLQFLASKEDANFYKTILPYKIKYIGNKGFTWHIYIDNIDKKLKSLGLLFCDSSTKFIPDVYLHNSYNTRLELLKGLMDGDGCAINRAGSVYVTTSKRLANDVMLLCRSLGFKVNEQNATQTIYKKSYRLNIATNKSIFKLPRKVSKQHVYTPYIKGSKSSAILYKTPIVSIEYVGKKKCKCVSVDNPDGLYLIGDYVTTHNCNKKGIYAYFAKFNCLHLLADTPDYLKDRQSVAVEKIGNKAKGVNATNQINAYADSLTNKWLTSPWKKIVKDKDGNETEQVVPRLYQLKCRAFIQECIAYSPNINVDRVRSFGMLMLYREAFSILYGGDLDQSNTKEIDKEYIGNDKFFVENYDNKFINNNELDTIQETN